MITTRRFLKPLFSLAALMLLVSCATTDYIPDESAVSNMSVREAHLVLRSFRGANFNRSGWEDGIAVKSIQVVNRNLVVTRRSDNATYTFPMKDVQVSLGTMGGWPTVDINGYHLWGISPGGTNGLGGITPSAEGPARARQIADAIFVLKQDVLSKGDPQKEEKFAEIARAYREATTKPVLTEDVRRFKVQAEGAVNDKAFNDAADFYAQALGVAPWWPEGHFNLALILGETGDYESAIIEMKHYLLLVPNAPDARAVQDKIYDWERKAEK